MDATQIVSDILNRAALRVIAHLGGSMNLTTHQAASIKTVISAALITESREVAALFSAGVVTVNERLTSENSLLRAALANSKDPCVYCQLPADKMAECKRGFPGCGRADDMTGCPEFGAAMQLHFRDQRIAELEAYVLALKAGQLSAEQQRESDSFISSKNRG